ncbi:glucokinase [Vreelandella utahensis]|uniref:glucokinase n=1 Tax=Vreelandella halophila TaxID=86177 RepID=UPI0009876B50|nr:glucokinase [Halomonas utahensis]
MTETPWALVGDIGGTNARFALVEPGSGTLNSIAVLPCGDYGNLDVAVRDYLQQTGAGEVRRACMAFACPVHDEMVRMTNNPWVFRKAAMRESLGLDLFKTINDFTAMALGVPSVPSEHLHPVGDGMADSQRPRLVIGPGTGLGISALIPTHHDWVPLETEGGHVDFAPTDELEVAVQQTLRARFGRVSVERILSGQGLLNLYQTLAELERASVRLHTPEAVTEAALQQEDPLAHRALRMFCEILGRVTGDAALTLGSLGGVYICGGIVPRFLDVFRDSPFRRAFEEKGRMRAMMESIPVYVVTEPYTGLLGAAQALDNGEV